MRASPEGATIIPALTITCITAKIELHPKQIHDYKNVCSRITNALIFMSWYLHHYIKNISLIDTLIEQMGAEELHQKNSWYVKSRRRTQKYGPSWLNKARITNASKRLTSLVRGRH